MQTVKLAIVILSCFMCLLSFGQVQHNFDMEPGKTDCHELVWVEDDSINVSAIRNATYRFSESMQISRYRSPRALHYYSCDGAVGYLIADENDSSLLAFRDIPKTTWDSLTNSIDPIGMYQQMIKQE